jgi:hypothetical protein
LFCFIGYPRGPFSGDFFKHPGMGKKRLRRKYKIGFFLVLLFFVTYGMFWLVNRWPQPPITPMKTARQTVSEARKAKAQYYASGSFQKTCRLYDSAMYYWRVENQRFILNRNYSKAVKYANLTTASGRSAIKNAIEKAKYIHQTTGAIQAELEKKVADFEATFSPLPIEKSVRQKFNRAVMLITEAKLAREKSDLHIAEEKLTRAKTMIVDCEVEVKSMLQNYFTHLPQWKNMVDNAISVSESNNSVAIIVVKLAHKCYIYQNGKLIRSFDAEFGPNWIGNKMYKGDKATPEGIYRVTSKKDKRKTIYHKALTLNYPNEDDRIRFYNNVVNGRVSRKSDVGGSIEIHGNGGRGFDWTNGCIGLEDNHMDVVYSMVSVATPVIIVGSVDPLEKFLENVREKSIRN